MKKCEICGGNKELSFHSYIPRSIQSDKNMIKLYGKEVLKNYGCDICLNCHCAIHNIWNDVELSIHFNTKQKIVSNPKFKNYLNWIQKQNV